MTEVQGQLEGQLQGQLGQVPPAPLRPHSFDGIEEFDNRLPNWWLWTFYVACIFAVVYWMHYHVLGTGALPAQQYLAEMQAAEERLAERMAGVELTDDLLADLSAEPTVVAKGKAIFEANCAVCHRADAGGMPGLGPNLTDRFWLHGGRPLQIYETVTKGVVAKGMLAWLPQLGPQRCQQVVAFVLSRKNTEVAGGREPQGEPEQ
jgi:cytochrome c oxidase cbb3-type subunit 3